MALKFTIKGIDAKKINSTNLLKELEKGLKDEAKIHRRELGKPVATWGDAPKMESQFTQSSNIMQTMTGPTGSDKAVNKFVWLNNGTRIRWALMSSNWQSKTAPRRFSSGRGRGNVVIAGRRAMQKRNIRPRPGITARGWVEELEKIRKQAFRRDMAKAVARGAKLVY